MALRLLSLNLAIVVLVAWCASHWVVADLSIRVPSVQIFVRCDSGGWFLDFRFPSAPGPNWLLDAKMATPAELVGMSGDAERSVTAGEFCPTIDAFDRAAFWSWSVPGLRFLKESNGGLHRWAFGVRHLILLAIACLTAAVYRRVCRRLENDHEARSTECEAK